MNLIHLILAAAALAQEPKLCSYLGQVDCKTGSCIDSLACAATQKCNSSSKQCEELNGLSCKRDDDCQKDYKCSVDVCVPNSSGLGMIAIISGSIATILILGGFTIRFCYKRRK
jgi:hypothetical protein